MSTSTKSLVGCYDARTNRLFGKFLLLVLRISWWQLGSAVHFPLIGSWCRALGSSSPHRVSIYWPICTAQCRLSRCPHIVLPVLSRPKRRKSIPALPALVPCYVAKNGTENKRNSWLGGLEATTLSFANNQSASIYIERLIREHKRPFKKDSIRIINEQLRCDDSRIFSDCQHMLGNNDSAIVFMQNALVVA